MLIHSRFQTIYYRAITIKIAWYWNKNRHKDQWIRIEDPDIKTHCYSQLIFHKGAKAHDGEKRASSTSVAGKTNFSI
jgi:hypothetical protein